MKKITIIMLTVIIVMFTNSCGGSGGDSTPTNSVPVANAGPDQSVLTSDTVIVDGSGSSDADGDPLTYSWNFTSKPLESNASLYSTMTEETMFTADVTGQYVLSLVVNDGKVDSSSDSITITANDIVGVLDTTFNLDGMFSGSVSYWQTTGSGKDIIFDGAGNIYVTGYIDTIGGDRDMAIWKYNSDGILDTTFGSDGIVVHDIVLREYGNAITLDSMGNIYVAGESFNSSINTPDTTKMVIWKYKSDGSLDTTFGSDGIVVQGGTAGNRYDVGKDIILDGSGNIYVTGSSENITSDYDMVIWKYKSDGSLDSTFDSDGIVVYNSAAGEYGNDSGNGIVLDNMDNIYVTGTSTNTLNYNKMVIWKYKSDGSLDTTFGSDGIVLQDTADSVESGRAITLDATGNIYVMGNSSSLTEFSHMVTWKYKSDGILDTNFGSDGIAAGGVGTGVAFLLDSLGNIYVTGTYGGDMIIWRFRSDGSLDTTFGSDGTVVQDGSVYPYDSDIGRGITLDSEGKIYVTGHNSNMDEDYFMTIWKYK